MQSATRKSESAASESGARRATSAAKKTRLAVLLITVDDTLWPQIGPHLGADMLLKQVDSVDELLTAVPAGQAAIILWDARNQTDAGAVLSRMQLHSPRFAVAALDDAANGHAWSSPIALRQVIAHVPVPIDAPHLRTALEGAQEEVNARMALLGESGAAPAAAPAPADGSRTIPWVPIGLAMAAAMAAAAAYLVLNHRDAAVAPPAAAAPAARPSTKPAPGADDKVDLLIEKAQQAMLERHYLDPADGSALALYRSAVLLDPGNGEARQGLQRLAEILFARAQSALDERKFDVALQSLETARSIKPGDSRLAALDARIASLRAEFGPAQILAAIAAQNFDRAAQLIDDATRSKSLGAAKLAQLRDELRRRHEEADTANFVKLIDSRLQQEKLLEPHNDNAAYFLAQARAAGVSSAALQSQYQELGRLLVQSVHADIEQRRFADAEKILADLHGYGVPSATVAGLEHDLDAARSQQAAPPPAQPQYLDLAQSRLAQGKITAPDNDNALYYVNQLRASDPKNAALPGISSAVQASILEQAGAALDAAQPAEAQALAQMAAGLGASAELAALNQRLAQAKQAGAGMPTVTEAALTRIKGIELDYPEEALRKNIEGWVDLSYVVTAEGKVASVKVLDSSPAGVFDRAATRALARVRYTPMMQGGKPIAVGTRLRIAFRMGK